MYYILKNDLLADFNASLNEPTGFPREVNFISGALIQHEFNEPLVYTTNAKSGDSMVDFSRGSVTLMSKRFLQVLKNAGVDNLQTFAAVVKSEQDDTIWNDFFAVNVLGLIACAQLDKSTYNEIMPGHMIFTELAIDASKAKDALLFRLQEHSPTLLAHRDVIRALIDKDPNEDLLGWEFEEIIQ